MIGGLQNAEIYLAELHTNAFKEEVEAEEKMEKLEECEKEDEDLKQTVERWNQKRSAVHDKVDGVTKHARK